MTPAFVVFNPQRQCLALRFNVSPVSDCVLSTCAGSEWLFKNKQHGMLSAAASVGMLLLWDVENGFSSIDKYSLSTHVWIKAGALMANGRWFVFVSFVLVLFRCSCNVCSFLCAV